MNEKPILFSGPMIRAILAGKKTQTRRVIREPDNGVTTTISDGRALAVDRDGEWAERISPYGLVGGHLWVRETFCVPVVAGGKPQVVAYRATEEIPNSIIKWKPSIFMPRALSRITLEITEIRVERLQEISELDAKAEGVDVNATLKEVLDYQYPSYRTGFRKGWDELNAKRGFGWDKNSYVWVISFRRIKP